jgi:hypothetical protein
MTAHGDSNHTETRDEVSRFLEGVFYSDWTTLLRSVRAEGFNFPVESDVSTSCFSFSITCCGS